MTSGSTSWILQVDGSGNWEHIVIWVHSATVTLGTLRGEHPAAEPEDVFLCCAFLLRSTVSEPKGALREEAAALCAVGALALPAEISGIPSLSWSSALGTVPTPPGLSFGLHPGFRPCCRYTDPPGAISGCLSSSRCRPWPFASSQAASLYSPELHACRGGGRGKPGQQRTPTRSPLGPLRPCYL